jgi:hypothetical protein
MAGRRFTLLFLSLLLIVPMSLFAQTAQVGQISGTVKDATGGVLPGVSVEVKHEEQGFTRTAQTDTHGQYRFLALPLGPYTVTATLSGFETATARHNIVEKDKVTDVPLTMKLGATTEAITVTGEVPIVDKTNVTDQTRVRAEEFQKLPVGRSYQALTGFAPGIPTNTGGNVNAHGALNSNNQFLFDGADTTDPTTGTFAANLNYEAIQEVDVYTSGISAEYGRATGAIVNVITKSGGNQFSGSAKWLGTNDNWNGQNRTRNQVTGASLARTKFDHVNPTQSYTLGGPFWIDHAWFFGTYEKQKSTSAQRQTVVVPDNFQQTLVSPFWDARATVQIGANNNVWVKKNNSPTNGFVIDYWGGSQVPILAANAFALTRQDQTANNTTGQWSGVFGSNVTAEFIAAKSGETITVFPFSVSPITGGAPHFSEADGFFYNGATFNGFVDRPRRQANGAVSYFVPLGGSTHSFKVGGDYQTFKSTNQFAFPNNQLFTDVSFDPFKGTFEPDVRDDYDPAVQSTSQGKITSVYARDKFDVAKHLFMEAGLRFEKQRGHSDVGQATVDTSTVSPRLSVSYDLRGDGKSIVLGTAGRFYEFINQNLSDQFAQVPQQGNYNEYVWDGTKYVFSQRFVVGGSNFHPNTNIKPTYDDEITLGFQQQFGTTVGVGIRGIYRKWHDLIDDVNGFNPDGSLFRYITNYGPAKRNYKAVELTYEKRFSNHWNAAANYTYSRTRGNEFADAFSPLGDFVDSQCVTGVDPTIGTNGRIPCSVAQEGANKIGYPTYDRPHDLKVQTAYTFDIGPVSLTTGLAGEAISGQNYTPSRTLTVINPVTGKTTGNTVTYFYTSRGADHLPGYAFADASLEATWRVYKTAEFGFKGEAFNVTDMQNQTAVNNTTYCANTTNPSASCSTARARFGTATARGSFYAPRSFRLTALVRF